MFFDQLDRRQIKVPEILLLVLSTHLNRRQNFENFSRVLVAVVQRKVGQNFRHRLGPLHRVVQRVDEVEGHLRGEVGEVGDQLRTKMGPGSKAQLRDFLATNEPRIGALK